jgi:1,4-alpha-glucan branching enzyme
MKHKHNLDKDHKPDPQTVPVRFEFDHPTAATVCLAGTFNDWSPIAKPMHHSGKGHWLKDTVLAPGSYEYCLVVDGQWMADPMARETVPNPFGGANSVLKVATSPQAAHLDDAENLPLENLNQQKTLNV